MIHTTNYFNCFIEVSEDCPAKEGTVPPLKADKPTIANRQFDMIAHHPYKYTSDDVIFQVYADRNGINRLEYGQAREALFSRGQACLRASPLGKRYGWGVHSDDQGRVALYAVESAAYKRLAGDARLQHVKAMRTKKG